MLPHSSRSHTWKSPRVGTETSSLRGASYWLLNSLVCVLDSHLPILDLPVHQPLQGHPTPRHLHTPAHPSLRRVDFGWWQRLDFYLRPSSLPACSTIAEARDLPFRSAWNERDSRTSGNFDLQDLSPLSWSTPESGCHVGSMAEDLGYPWPDDEQRPRW